MRDPRLDELAAGQRRLVRVSDDIDECNPVKSDHLLKVNVARVIPVDIVHRETKVRPVGVRL